MNLDLRGLDTLRFLARQAVGFDGSGERFWWPCVDDEEHPYSNQWVPILREVNHPRDYSAEPVGMTDEEIETVRIMRQLGTGHPRTTRNAGSPGTEAGEA